MKRGSTLFLKTAVVLIAVVVFAAMIKFPQTEGRAEGLDLISIYSDPFIIYLYIASIPFFAAFYQAFKILGLIDKNKVFTQSAVNAVRNIKYCAVTLIAFIIPAITFVIMNHGEDDAAGFIMIGIITIFASTVMATATAVLQRLLQNAVDIKSEHDMTV